MKNQIKELVNHMITYGTESTTSGNYIFYYDRLSKVFNLPIEWLKENHEVIKEEVDCREEVISETWDELDEQGNLSGFDVNFCLQYCPNADFE